jgi:hypothetical protein
MCVNVSFSLTLTHSLTHSLSLSCSYIDISTYNLQTVLFQSVLQWRFLQISLLKKQQRSLKHFLRHINHSSGLETYNPTNQFSFTQEPGILSHSLSLSHSLISQTFVLSLPLSHILAPLFSFSLFHSNATTCYFFPLSGVGTAAIQLAKMKELNTHVIITAGSQRKLDFCKSLGPSFESQSINQNKSTTYIFQL